MICVCLGNKGFDVYPNCISVIANNKKVNKRVAYNVCVCVQCKGWRQNRIQRSNKLESPMNRCSARSKDSTQLICITK